MLGGDRTAHVLGVLDLRAPVGRHAHHEGGQQRAHQHHSLVPAGHGPGAERDQADQRRCPDQRGEPHRPLAGVLVRFDHVMRQGRILFDDLLGRLSRPVGEDAEDAGEHEQSQPDAPDVLLPPDQGESHDQGREHDAHHRKVVDR